MYKLSYEKCVCFLFLVIVAILSCSGFRIDSLAMTDISKRNSHTSSSLANPQDYFPFTETQNLERRPHRIRHHHQAPLSERRPAGRIDAYRQPREQTATVTPSTPIVARSQRSSRPQRRHHNTCQEQDVARKAYLANTVVLARAESKSTNPVQNYSVTFRIVERLKNSSTPVDDHIRVDFSSDKKNMRCAKEEELSSGLVKASIEVSKEYFLFLNVHEPHKYPLLGMPVLSRERNKKKLRETILRVVNPNFEPKPPKIVSLRNVPTTATLDRKLRLVCKTKGFPTPYLQWTKDDEVLSSNSKVRITYKKKRTTLVIKNVKESDRGRYWCTARGVDSRSTSAYSDVEPPNTSEKPKYGEKCEEPYRQHYCHNGGSCFYVSSLGENACECAEGYTGKQCDEKDVLKQSSMYGQSLYTCKLGLSTKYYC